MGCIVWFYHRIKSKSFSPIFASVGDIHERIEGAVLDVIIGKYDFNLMEARSHRVIDGIISAVADVFDANLDGPSIRSKAFNKEGVVTCRNRRSVFSDREDLERRRLSEKGSTLNNRSFSDIGANIRASDADRTVSASLEPSISQGDSIFVVTDNRSEISLFWNCLIVASTFLVSNPYASCETPDYVDRSRLFNVDVFASAEGIDESCERSSSDAWTAAFISR